VQPSCQRPFLARARAARASVPCLPCSRRNHCYCFLGRQTDPQDLIPNRSRAVTEGGRISDRAHAAPSGSVCRGADHRGPQRALAATFSPELPDLTIYVIDVAEGENIPRRGGPGITRSDLLVINKIDLAPLVGADLDVMESDTLRMRVNRPFVFSSLRSGEGVEQIARFIIKNGGL
jgi:hypothetical protein